ncbi:MAG: hypothetical protein OZ921_20800 [Sorangiineae bacterium]|nr:hypothetical protein [Polyangiaceae bacterium]MEB2324966.1 hypothetical protein [Sorangiineae bacterium]
MISPLSSVSPERDAPANPTMSKETPRRPARHRARARLIAFFALAALVAASLAQAGCVKSYVNASPNLRWWLFSNFGAQHICPEMLKRGAGLKLAPGGNIIGRFFPDQCRYEINDPAKTLAVHFGGTGYAWTPVAGRMGFSATMSVEYRPDFYLSDEAVYVWARFNRLIYGPDFKIGSVENKVVDWAATQTPAGYLANTFGNQLVQSQLSSGFTVVRSDEGDDFSLGILQPPARPAHPFTTSGSDRYVFANETTEVRYGQVDFLGPFEVADSDQALFLRFRAAGPEVEALVVTRGAGDRWRGSLQLGAPLGPPPESPLTGFRLPPAGEVRQKLKLQPGQYYVVIDNSAAVGQVAPAWNPLAVVGGATTTVSYTAELGDADSSF